MKGSSAVLLAAVALTSAVPVQRRSQQEVDAFRNFLEQTRTPDGVRLKTSQIIDPEVAAGKFEGDILLDNLQVDAMVEQFAAGRNAYTWPNTKWPNNTIVYEYGAGEFGPLQTAAIEAGIADIEKHTCLRFRYRTSADTVYTRLTGEPSGCYANVGYWDSRGVHTFNVARNVPGFGCFRHTTIVHEWLHIIGFLHMQSTHNRDEYVRIAWENIQPGMENNFSIYGADLVDNLDLPYDYVSCMHYPPDGFSVNGLPTIVAIQDHEGTMGQREIVTEMDWLRVNRHYNCAGAWD